MNELKAIELGKIWMRNSLNKGHDYEHASAVEKHGLAIYKSLKEDGRLKPNIDEELVSLVAWWHDSYKARLKYPTIKALIFEGYESEKIVEKELKNYLSKDRLAIIKDAIRYHNHPWIYFVLTNKFNQLRQILLEADNIEVFSEKRLDRSFPDVNSIVVRAIFKLFCFDIIFWFKVLPVSRYTKQYITKLKI
ncbi:MAG TPA: hypothetical protein VHA74_01180 [Candidatus Dojkabacteria bacterium]|nr:hypothetical protein [Candidatus Dojkabacteria bacterium]